MTASLTPTPQRVTPLSAADETRTVLRVALALVTLALLAVAARRGAGARPFLDLLPGQRAFASLEPADQRRVRAMQEGLAELVRLRDDAGTWASVEQLAGELVPPFADDPLEQAGYAWTRVRAGRFASYFGVPGATGAPALLIQGAEPDPLAPEPVVPGAPPDPTHRKLGDGTLLHVALWLRAAELGPVRLDSEDPLPDPALGGWSQIVIQGTPR